MPLLVEHSLPLWGIWKIEESSDELLKLLENKQPYYSFVTDTMTEARKREWLASRVLVKRLLGFEPDISYTDAGAPFLVGLSKRISISHTKGFAAVILSDNPAAGIDIEYKSDRILRIAHKFVSTSELNYVEENNKVDYFNIIWCSKEVLFKVAQREGVDFIENLLVSSFTLSNGGRVKGTCRFNAFEDGYLLEYLITDDWYLVYRVK